MAGRPARTPRPLYVGEWIRALGMRPADVSRGTGVNEGYLSQLISGAKRNPSSAVLGDIAEYLSIPLEYFYRRPPDRELAAQVSEIDFNTLQRIGRATDKN